MKVTPFLSLIPPRSNNAAATSGHVSFAAFLASGRKMSDITSGRALGFSETGIMGAYRVPPRVADPDAETIRPHATAPTASISGAFADPQPSPRSSQVVPRQGAGTAHPPLSAALLASHSFARIVDTDSQETVRLTTQLNRQVTLDAVDVETPLILRGLFRQPQIPERRRVLSAVLVDSEGTMAVNAAVPLGGEILSDELLTEIEKVLREFGMTLKHIVIDGKQIARFTVEIGEDKS